MIVCVLGMHRAGTSVTARVLNLLGMYVGPDEALVRANPNNPKGTYEHRELMLVNQSVLQVVGGMWKEPPSLPEGWQNDPALDPARGRAREVIEETFEGIPLWGWKDPRTALIVPFWKTVLPQMRYVICIRNPLDVAASLAKRNDLPAAQSFDLWLRYVVDSIVDTAAQPRTFVFYEDYFEDAQSQATRLADFIDRPEQASQARVRESVQDWLELNLRHHRSDASDAVGCADLPIQAKSLYLLLHLAFRTRLAANDGVDAAPAAGADRVLNLFAGSLGVAHGRGAEPRGRAS